MRPSAETGFRRRVAPHRLPEKMDGDCTYDDFRDCVRSLEQVNRWLLGYRPTLAWLERLPRPSGRTLHILDVGSGGGGLLRRIAGWAKRRGIDAELTGIDLNPYAAWAAAESTPAEFGITWVTGDVLKYHPDRPVDIVTCALMAHHLENDEIVRLLRWMESNAQIGWFVNDLERSELSSRLFTWVAALAGWHPFVRHDGPVSFQRSFRQQDWLPLLQEAEVPQDAEMLQHWWPGRLCLGRRK